MTDSIKASARRWIKEIMLLLVIAAVALWLGGWARANIFAPNSAVVNVAAVELVQLDNGMPIPLADTSGNRLLYLFAPWCSICELTFPKLAEIAESHSLVAVALDYQRVAEVEQFVVDSQSRPPQVVLGDGHLQQQLGVVAFPTYMVVSPTGEILSKRVGYLPNWMLSLYLLYWSV